MTTMCLKLVFTGVALAVNMQSTQALSAHSI